MDIEIFPSKLNGSLQAVSSKSDVHRALICAAFADAPTEICCNLLSKDIEATARCLSAAGADIKLEIDSKEGSGTISVKPAAPHDTDTSAVLTDTDRMTAFFCGESGSTLRFLVPVMAALGLKAYFTGAGELPNRPMDALISLLRTHRVCVDCMGARDGEALPLQLSGKLLGGLFALPGNISSQYITGLLLAFPLIGERSEIRLTTELQSAAYVDMTLDTMSRFGISIEKTKQGYIYLPEKEARRDKLPYRSPGKYSSDGDWSNAAFWLCAGCLTGNSISVEGLRSNSLQGDRAILDILRMFDRSNILKTSGQAQYAPRVIDASGIPDLIPAVAALAAVVPGTTEIIHAGRLRLKECDRLSALCDVLGKMGAGIEEHPEGLTIQGAGDEGLCGGCEVSGHNDHRIVMAAAIAASACRESVLIRGAQAVQKSYPHFFSDFQKLGGKTDVIDVR